MHQPNILKAGIREVTFGTNVTVIEPCNLYECKIGNDCFIGPFVEIQKGVAVGDGSRIQSHSLICEMVNIEENCFIGHGVTFINDTFRSGKVSYDSSTWEKTNVRAGAIIGSNATILPVEIAAGTIVAAGAVVTKDLIEPGIYAGSPARLLRKL